MVILRVEGRGNRQTQRHTHALMVWALGEVAVWRVGRWWWWCGPVCSAHVSVDMSAQDAPNYGGRVPVDTTPGPAPVCRAQKNLPIITAVEADSWNRSLRGHSDVHHGICRCTQRACNDTCTTDRSHEDEDRPQDPKVLPSRRKRNSSKRPRRLMPNMYPLSNQEEC